MSDVLAEIIEHTRNDVAERQRQRPESALRERTQLVTPPRGFRLALQAKASARRPGLVAEIKKASPSHGLIRGDFNPAALARAYETGGATCLSVLTNEHYFQGHSNHLSMARSACRLPVLRKEFIIEPYQVIESRALGADCILLILAALSDRRARELEALAHALHMDVLLEVHDTEELQRALLLSSKLIGINNRNLKTLRIDLSTTLSLRPLIPADYTVVAESGITSHSDILRMQRSDIYSFLVGEALMREENVEQATRTLLGGASLGEASAV